MLLKFFSTLFGYNYEVVKAQTTVSKQKIVTLGTLMLIPVSLWTISGYYIGYNLLGASFIKSLIGGVFVGGLILIIDKSFISTPKASVTNWLKGFRFTFAIIATILGSIAMDLMFFGGDLEEYRTKQTTLIKKAESNNYLKENNAELVLLNKKIEEQSTIVETSKKDWKEEADGKAGTGRSGLGKVAALKERLYFSDSAILSQMNIAKDSLNAELVANAALYGEKMAIKRSDALMSKITDLHAFIFESGLSMFFYALFFAVIFSLEIFFLLTKSSMADSLFEKMLLAEEMIGNQKLETLIANRQETLRQDGLMGSRAEQVRRLAYDGDRVRKIG